MTSQPFPKGWDEAQVRSVIEAYESQTEDQALAEDEAALEDPAQAFIAVPVELVPAVRNLIAKHKN